ncbi:MAG: NAD-dependent epimerase/dehydratase family protein [Saprospiraceae bacterium]|nr:NAD-dependent epimerase/dehydratase family protein [Saprospiraceae bacterium]
MNEEQRLHELTTPSPSLVQSLKRLEGDIMILGAGGKMGPSLIKLLQRTLEHHKISKQIYAVSRFSDPLTQESCEGFRTTLLQGDLLDESFLQRLPKVENVLYLAGLKFGSMANQSLTWAMNAYLPGRIAETFSGSRIVAFSTGNVYPLMPTAGPGATELTPPAPIGEYAQSCLGRERIFTHFSKTNKTRMLLFRLNYALDLRYGVLTDIGHAVWTGQPVDLAMGYVNFIWQGDANAYAIQCLEYCDVPPTILNITGPETLSVRFIAEAFARQFDRPIRFSGKEQPTALLSDSSRARMLLGEPRISAEEMIEWSAEWIASGGMRLNKPTHFQERTGKF